MHIFDDFDHGLPPLQQTNLPFQLFLVRQPFQPTYKGYTNGYAKESRKVPWRSRQWIYNCRDGDGWQSAIYVQRTFVYFRVRWAILLRLLWSPFVAVPLTHQLCRNQIHSQISLLQRVTRSSRHQRAPKAEDVAIGNDINIICGELQCSQAMMTIIEYTVDLWG